MPVLIDQSKVAAHVEIFEIYVESSINTVLKLLSDVATAVSAAGGTARERSKKR
jgi:hypothetical protein